MLITVRRSVNRPRSNRPAFLVAHAGTWLVILGVVLTETRIIQQPTDYIRALSPRTRPVPKHSLRRHVCDGIWRRRVLCQTVY
ncbi:hypothetical protein BDR05DRAFT_961201, partial [Suillus weaverae]